MKSEFAYFPVSSEMRALGNSLNGGGKKININLKE